MIKQEEPCEGRLSSTVPWERQSEILWRDPIMGNEFDDLSLKNENKNEF